MTDVSNAIAADNMSDGAKGRALVEAFDQVEAKVAEEFAAPEPTPEPEPQPVPEAQLTEESAPELDPQPQPEETPQLSNKANKRFQDLANRAKDAEAQNESLRQELATLAKAMQSQTELQQKAFQTQQAIYDKQQEAMKPQQIQQEMLRRGLDPNEQSHRDLYDQISNAERMQARMAQMEQQMRAYEDQRIYNSFSNATEQALRAELAGYKVESFDAMVEDAVALAASKGYTASDAAKRVAKLIKDHAPKKTAKKPDPSDAQVLAGIAASGRTGGRTPNSDKAKTFDDVLSEWGS